MLGEKLEVPSTLSPESWAVMAKMRNQKNIDASPLYCKTVYETDGTKDKKFFDFTMAAKIPVLKGGSFDLWEPQKGVNYASIEPEVARKLLWGKLSKSAGRANSPFSTNQFSYELLPMDLRRIAYRWTTNSTNSRTMVASFVGPGVVLTNQAPYLIPHQDESKNEALLGVLSSRVFDWYVRRFVEGTMRQGILNAMPFPELDDKSIGQISEAVQLRLRSKEPQDFIELESHIDHLVARAYGLDTRDLSVIFSSFHPTWRYQPYLDLVTSASFDGRI